MIIVYSADWCAYCRMVKNYFDSKNVQYEERNVELNPDFMQESVQKSGQMGIPVIDFDGDIVIGFDRVTIDHHLEKQTEASA